MVSAPEISADKFDYLQGGDGDLVATGNAKIDDEKFELRADKTNIPKIPARLRRRVL